MRLVENLLVGVVGQEDARDKPQCHSCHHYNPQTGYSGYRKLQADSIVWWDRTEELLLTGHYLLQHKAHLQPSRASARSVCGVDLTGKQIWLL